MKAELAELKGRYGELVEKSNYYKHANDAIAGR